jgi:hypothetical protein
VLKIEATVKKKPVLPAEIAEFTFIPKPKPTTETCSKKLITLALNRKKGFPEILATTKPNSKATGGEMNPEIQTKSNITKMSCCTFIVVLKKVKVFLVMISG